MWRCPLTVKPSRPLGLTGDNQNNPTSPLHIKNLIHRWLRAQVRKDYVDRTFSDISNLSFTKQIELQAALDAFDQDSLVVEFRPLNYYRK